MKSEMMQDQMDMAMDADEGEADDVYNGILGEIGMSMNQNMTTGQQAIANPVAPQAVG